MIILQLQPKMAHPLRILTVLLVAVLVGQSTLMADQHYATISGVLKISSGDEAKYNSDGGISVRIHRGDERNESGQRGVVTFKTRMAEYDVKHEAVQEDSGIHPKPEIKPFSWVPKLEQQPLASPHSDDLQQNPSQHVGLETESAYPGLPQQHNDSQYVGVVEKPHPSDSREVLKFFSFLLKDIFGLAEAAQKESKFNSYDVPEMNYQEGSEDKFEVGLNARYPGTLWCGDKAGINVDDGRLGIFARTDECCRGHRQCPDIMKPEESKYSLTNTASNTRLHCSCDREFYSCLKNAGDSISRRIGVSYFNVLGSQCYERDYPIVKCVRWRGRKCLDYKLDVTRRQQYQWFDNQFF